MYGRSGRQHISTGCYINMLKDGINGIYHTGGQYVSAADICSTRDKRNGAWQYVYVLSLHQLYAFMIQSCILLTKL